MKILADVNVPEEYVSALRGDGHEVVYSHEIADLGPEATDETLVSYAESKECAVLSTDIKDVSESVADVPILVAPQDMTGGDVRAAVARLVALPFDPSETDPVWLTALKVYHDHLCRRTKTRPHATNRVPPGGRQSPCECRRATSR